MDYFRGKLFEINYRIASHNGDAARRLANQAGQIQAQLAPLKECIPENFRSVFSELLTLIQSEDLPYYRLRRIPSEAAEKYIRSLRDIEGTLDIKYPTEYEVRTMLIV